MRKFIVLLSLFLFAFSSIVYAWSAPPVAQNIVWSTCIRANETGDYVGYTIPLQEVNVGASILGYVIIPINGSAQGVEAVVGLYDGVGGAGIISDEIFDEAESDGKQSLPNWFPMPRRILTGLLIHIGPNTRVIVYYNPV